MNVLKPLFFGKYKPRNEYQYGAEWQDVSINRGEGKLSIKILEANGESRGVIILSHPMKEMGKYFFIAYGHAQLYHSLGYHIVLFDFNGFGESTDTKNFNFTQDVLDTIEVTKQYFPNAHIGLHGVSFGASQIILAALDDESKVNGLLVESAVSSNIDYYRGRGSNLFHILNAYNAFFPSKNAHNLYYNVVTQIKSTPILYLYGEQDVITPLWMGEKLYENTPTDKELVILQAHHLTLITDEPDLYRQTIQKFWNRCL